MEGQFQSLKSYIRWQKRNKASGNRSVAGSREGYYVASLRFHRLFLTLHVRKFPDEDTKVAIA